MKMMANGVGTNRRWIRGCEISFDSDEEIIRNTWDKYIYSNIENRVEIGGERRIFGERKQIEIKV